MIAKVGRIWCVLLMMGSLCLERLPAESSEWEWHAFPVPLQAKIGFGVGGSWVFSLHEADGLCVFLPSENRYLVHENILEKNRPSGVSGNWFVSSDPESGDTRVWDLETGGQQGRFFVRGEGKLIGWVGHPEAGDRALAVMIHPFGQDNAEIRLVRVQLPDGNVVESMAIPSQGNLTSGYSVSKSKGTLADFSVIRLGLGSNYRMLKWQTFQRVGAEYLPFAAPDSEPMFFSSRVCPTPTRGVPAHGAELTVSVESDRVITVRNPHNGHLILRIETPPRQSSNDVRPATFSPRELPVLDVVHHRVVYLPNSGGGLFTRRLHLAEELRGKGRSLAIPLTDIIPPVIPGVAWSYRPRFLTDGKEHAVSLRVLSTLNVTVDEENTFHFRPDATRVGGLAFVVQAEYRGGVFEYTVRARPAHLSGNGHVTPQFELSSWDHPNLFVDTGGEVDTLLPAWDQKGILFRRKSDNAWGVLDVNTARVRFMPDVSSHTLLATGAGKVSAWNAASNTIRVYSLPDCVEIARFPNPLENPLVGLVMGEQRDDVALLVAVDSHQGQSRWTFDYVDLSTGERLGHNFVMDENMSRERPVQWFASPDLSVVTFRAHWNREGWISARPSEGTWVYRKGSNEHPLYPLPKGLFLNCSIFDEDGRILAQLPQEESEAAKRRISWQPLPGSPLVYALRETLESENLRLQIREKEDFSLFLDLQGPPAQIFSQKYRSGMFDLHRRTLLNLKTQKFVLAPRTLPGLVIAQVPIPADLEIPEDPSSASFPRFRREDHAGDSSKSHSEPTLPKERREERRFHFSKDARKWLSNAESAFPKQKFVKGGWLGIREETVPSVVEVRSPQSAGTAFVVSPDGLMVTSKSAILPFDKPFSLRIPHASGGVLVYEGVVVAWHEQHEIVLVRPKHDRKWPPLHLSVRESPRQGESLAVLGNPLNEGQPLYHTFREGVLSHTSRLIGGLNHYQISISSTPGLPGSPVLDQNGNVIAVVSGHPSTAEGVGFAIPSPVIMEKLIEFEYNSSEE